MLTVGALKYFEETGSCFSPVGTVFFNPPNAITWHTCKYSRCHVRIWRILLHALRTSRNNIIQPKWETLSSNIIFLFSSFLVGSIHSWGKVSFRNLVLFYNVMRLTLLIRISLEENVNNQERPKALPTLEKANRTKQCKLQTSPFYFLHTENCCRERAQ